MIRCSRFLSRSSVGEAVVVVVAESVAVPVAVAVAVVAAVVAVAAVVFVAVTEAATTDEVIADLMSPDSKPVGEVWIMLERDNEVGLRSSSRTTSVLSAISSMRGWGYRGKGKRGGGSLGGEPEREGG